MVLSRALQAIGGLRACASLSESNSVKLSQLSDKIISSIRECVADKEIEVCSFDQDELSNLSAWMARLSLLGERVDLVSSLDDTQGLKQTSLAVIVDALADRGSLADQDEDKVKLLLLSCRPG